MTDSPKGFAKAAHQRLLLISIVVSFARDG